MFFKTSNKRNLVRIGSVVGSILFVVGCVSIAFYKAIRLETANEESVFSHAIMPKSPDSSKEEIAIGCTVDLDGRAVSGAKVTLSVYSIDGQEVWSTIFQANDAGIFKIHEKEIPLVKDRYGAILKAEAPDYLAAKKNVVIEVVELPKDTSANPVRPTTRLKITPSLNQLVLTHYNSWLSLIVMFPAIFGLILATLHLTRLSDGMRVTYWYVIGTAFLWCAIVAELIGVYVMCGHDLIPLFWSDLFISSGVVIFAFIGSVIYVAYNMHVHDPATFIEADFHKRRKILLTLGGRILVAPYVALTGYGIFAVTFPALRTGPFAAFFGFFTGLWIKPVLEALNDIGIRFLSADQQRKVAEWMATEKVENAPPLPTSDSRFLKPDQAFLDAVAEARKELLLKENVIGVVPGFKLVEATGNQTEPAIIVYVYEKQALSTEDQNHVPKRFRGYLTDVVALPPMGPNEECRPVMSKISWKTIHDKNTQPQSASAKRVANTQIILLLDPNEALFNRKSPQQEIFDVVGAYREIKKVIPDQFDFVSFAIDCDSGLPEISDYHVPVFNPIKGINYYEIGPGSFAEREAWGSDRLLACFVRSKEGRYSLYRYLHELGHYWCAYATFDNAKAKRQHSCELLLATDLYHWGGQFVDGSSPMDNDNTQWLARDDGRFIKKKIDAKEYIYCPLDLYLMGLMDKNEVKRLGPLRILRNPVRQSVSSTDSDGEIYTADVFEISIDDVISSCGSRIPAVHEAQTTFTQAMVVVSKNQNSGEKFAEGLETFRQAYETQFRVATDKRASLFTTITPIT